MRTIPTAVTRWRRWYAGSAVLSLAAACALSPVQIEESAFTGPPPPGTSSQVVRSREGLRRYVLHVPPPQSAAVQPLPLLMVLHGSGSSGAEIARFLELDSLADRLGVVVAYPDGKRGHLLSGTSDWNAGDCCGYPARRHVDDVGMLRALVDQLRTRLPIDRQRIYVAGFSDGGRMAYRAACELSDRVAAVGVVAGSLRFADCRPTYPVSLVAIHGTSDDEVPYDESIPARIDGPAIARTSHLSPSVRFWGALSGCSSYAERTLPPYVTMGTFGGCRGNEITLYSIAGGTHGWPHATSGGAGAGSPMESLAGSEVVLRFLLGHRRDSL